MKVYSVYCVQNTQNKKVYIGYTSQTPDKRWSEHLVSSTTEDTKWYRAIRKYGKDAFTLTCLYQTLDKPDVLEKEQWFIDRFQSIKNGYNTHVGGKGGNTGAYHKVGRPGSLNPMYGHRHSDEAKKAIGERSRIARQKWSATKKKDWADKVSVAQKGRPKNTSSMDKMRNTVRSKRRAHFHTVYELCSPTETFTLVGKQALVDFCENQDLSLWTVERILLNNQRPKSGNCVYWTAKITGSRVY